MISRLLVERVRRRYRDQQGFALIAMIAVIGLTSVIVLALLGLTFATTVFSGAQVQRDRRTRAADSAIDTAVEVLSKEGAELGAVSTTGDDCVVAGRTTIGGQDLPVVNVDGSDVVVTCTPQAPEDPPAPLVANSEDVRVVGSVYKGEVGRADLFPCPLGNTNCAPWTAALDPYGPSAAGTANAYVSASAPVGPTVIHTGPGPLTFSSDVTVRTGTGAVRNPPCAAAEAGAQRCTTDQFGPALAVSGLYRQGDSGLLDTNQANTKDCGVQSRWNEPAIKSMWIATLRLSPICDSPDARTFTPGKVALAAPKQWSDAELAAPVTLPTCSSSPSARLVTLPAGYYSPSQTATLNSWFRKNGEGGANCDGKVFLFQSGDYYFDVDDSAAPRPGTVAAPNSLTFDDPTSVVVFGNPDKWTPVSSSALLGQVVAQFPDATAPLPNEAPQAPCALDNPAVSTKGSGVTITLSSRTTLRHLRGRVAICDKRARPRQDLPPGPGNTAEPVNAIWQTPVLTNQYGAVPPSVAGSNDGTFVPSFTGLGESTQLALTRSLQGVSDGRTAVATANCPAESVFSWNAVLNFLAALGAFDLNNLFTLPRRCSPLNASFQVSAWNATLPTAPAPIDSLALSFEGSAQKVNFGGARLAVSVSGVNLKGPSGVSKTCTAIDTSTSSVSRTIDLLDPSKGNCSTFIDDLSNLVGATVSISFLNLTPACSVRIFGYNISNFVCRQSDGFPSISVDRVQVTGKLRQNRGPTTKPMRVTSNLKPVTSTDPVGGDTFNLFGRMSVPLADVDVRWEGTPTPEPIFGGRMVVNGIGSSSSGAKVGSAYVAKPGLVCCVTSKPSARTVTLNGWVDVANKPWPTLSDVTPKVTSGGSQVFRGTDPVFLDRMGNELVCPYGGRPRRCEKGDLTDNEFDAAFDYLNSYEKRVRNDGSRFLIDTARSDAEVLQGRLAATARVSMLDYRVLVTGQAKAAPGYGVRVESWQLCVSPMVDFPGLTAASTANVTCEPV